MILGLSLAAFGCSQQQPIAENSNAAPQHAERVQSTTLHTTENVPPATSNSNTGTTSKWTQSGDPIDTAKFDGTIKAAEAALKSKPADETAKKDLAQAYFDRGMALTQARQYASALGDYRHALKYDPQHEESQKWIDQITSIYSMMKKEAPKEGEEPPPLPFKKS